MGPFDRSLQLARRISWQHVLFFTLAANVPLWIVERAMGALPTGWINLDFLAAGIVSLYFPGWGAAVLLAATLVDLLAVVCETYYLLPGDAMRNLSALEQMPAQRIAGFIVIAFIVAAIAGASIFLRRSPSTRKATAWSLFLLACVLAGANKLQARHESGRWLAGPADTLNVSKSYQRRTARMPAKWLIHAEMDPWFRADAKESARIQANEKSARDVTGDFTKAAWATDSSPDIVLVVVESWGQAVDEGLRGALLKAYSQQNLDGYRIAQGIVPFNGPTVAGEVRELCDSDGAFRIVDAPASELTDCLPKRLAGMGYQTTAVHGMSGALFRRSNWYPKLGFDEMLFRKDFEAQGLPDCPGAFQGICDAAIADWIGDRLEQPSDRPRFTYWVTLNSHLPVPRAQEPSESCSAVRAPSDQAAICSWAVLVEKVHRAVAEVASRKLARPTMFIVVGDHAPPFADPVARDQFDRANVPFLVLTPKSARIPGASQVPTWSRSEDKPESHSGE